MTGFLGSGKTTLLRRVLAAPGLEGSCVLVNEVADTGVDDRLLKSVAGDVRLVEGGCVCCTARDELRSILLGLVETVSDVDDRQRIILETTGLAHPAPLIEAIAAHPVLHARIRLNGVLTAVDCTDANENARSFVEFTNQVIGADAVVITKADLVDEDAVDRTIDLVHGLNPYAAVTTANADTVGAFLKHGVTGSGIESRVGRMPSHSPLPHSGIRTFRIALEGDCDWTAFAIWLSLLVHAHGSHILRVKGLLDVAGAGAPVAINCVQSLVYFPEHLDGWPDTDRRPMLIFIVRNLEPALVLKSLRAFLRSDRPTLLPDRAECAYDTAEAATSYG
ncbi:MAG: GTP-binding protein [Sphingobium sp.]